MIFSTLAAAQHYTIVSQTIFRFQYKGEDGYPVVEYWVRDADHDEKDWRKNVAEYAAELLENFKFISLSID
jgi:hypothetical protein